MLDPADWDAFRRTSHEIVDRLIDSMQAVREQPTWQPVPETVKAFFDAPLPEAPQALAAVYGEFAANILPYPTGNIHPRFFGWVHGSGTPAGAIAELMAAVMNSNAGGREHSAVYVERQVIRWFCDLFGMHAGSGILLGGTSMANFAGLLVARTARLGAGVRSEGLQQAQGGLVGYASRATHNCVRKAFEMAGLGNAALRVIETDGRQHIDIAALEARIAHDREAGATPFIVIGNAGTVDTGAFDPLEHLAEIARRERLWFHVDGAFGAMAMLSDRLRPLVRGIEHADSIAFDFHKWLHVPYDAACLLVRDEAAHRATFASEGPYITRMARGTASGNPWFADYGPDLSRSFRALKVWLTLKHFGTRRIAAAIEMNCDQARHLAALVESDANFELAAPVALNIVCFRHKRCDNDALAIAVQESGRAVISSTTIGGTRVLRACFTNHRTQDGDVEELWAALRAFSESA